MTHSITKDTKKELPKNWKWVRLGEVCEIVSGTTPKTGEADYWNGEIVWITPTDLGKLSDRYILNSERRISEKGFDSCNLSIVRVGAVVLSSRAPIGHLGIASTPLCTNQGCKTFLPCSELDSEFLYHALKQSVWELKKMGSGATFAEVSKTQLKGFAIPLPPLSEQKRIAAILNGQMKAVDMARKAAEERLSAVKALPSAYLRAIFPAKDQPLPKGWKLVKLGDVVSQGPDNGIFKRREEFGGGVPIVNVSDLFRSLYVDISLLERVRVTEDELARFQIASGDLFFCRSSLKREGIGWCCIVKKMNEPSVFECHVMRLRLKSTDALSEYVAYYWQHPSLREELIGNARTATMTTMNQQDLVCVSIPLPSLKEQQRIVSVLTEQMAVVEQARKAAEDELEAIKRLPAALLRRAFNGEL